MKTLLFIILTCMLLGGCNNAPATTANDASTIKQISNTIDTYFIDGTLENNVFTATQIVSYVNKENVPLNELYFHLYANMYNTKEQTEPTDFEHNYPNGFNSGGITVDSVNVWGKPVDTETIKGRLLKINLTSPINPGESLLINFKYRTQIPNARTLLGYHNDCYNLSGFYPVAAVYDGKWCIDDLGHYGDYYYTDISDYYVSFSIPAPFVVASGGTQTTTEEGGYKTVKITAPLSRELAISADTQFKIFEKEVDGITIKSYSDNESDGRSTADLASECAAWFSQKFGKLPYNTISLVKGSFYSGAMEFPGVIFMDRDIFNGEHSSYATWVIIHEIAHQWWYSAVGSDPINDSFIDEALCEFSTILYLRHNFNEADAQALIDENIHSVYENHKYLVKDGTMHRPTTKVDSWMDCTMSVYIKGALMYLEMEKIVGEEKMLEILNNYYNTYRLDDVSAEEWKNHIRSSFEYDWDSFFEKWLYGNKM